MFRHRPAGRAVRGIVSRYGVALWLLLFGLAVPHPVASADPVAIPQGPVPVDEIQPVEFSYITIDAAISPAEGVTVVETRTQLRLTNPERRVSFEREVTFPGMPVSDVKIGTQTGGLRPVEGPGPWILQLPGHGDVVIEGVQRVSAVGPVVDLEFDWGRLAVWGSRLGAARLALHFPADLQFEQLLAVEPAPTEQSTVQLTWSHARLQPSGKVRVLFIAPHYWRPVHRARQAASGPQAGAAEYLALAAALQPLITAERMPEARAHALQAERLAALRQAAAAGSQDPRAHEQLATYLQQAAGGDPALLAEAAAQLKVAHDLAPGDAEIRQRLLAALDELILACRQAGDTHGLLAALDLVEAVEPQASQERAAAYADLIVGLLEAGQLTEAEATIVAGFGQEALDRYAHLRPHYTSVAGDVQTLIGQRTLRFNLVRAPGVEEAAKGGLASLLAALGRIARPTGLLGSAEISHVAGEGGDQVEVTMAFADVAELQSAIQGLARALPPEADPALLLIVAAAAPVRVEFQATHGRAADLLDYVEVVDLRPAQSALDGRLEEIKSARLEAEAPARDPLEAARRRWARELLERYSEGWQALAASCRVTYRLLPPEEIVAPYWTLAWGEQRSLTWSTSIPRFERLWPYVLGAGGAIAVLVVLLAVWQRAKPSEPTSPCSRNPTT